MPRVSCRRSAGALAVAIAALIAGRVTGQPPSVVPPVPPADALVAPVEPAPLPAEPGPPAGRPEPPSRTAEEAFSSLGGFGAGPAGGLGALLSPTVGNMPLRASVGFTAFPSEPVNYQPTSLAFYREDLAVSAPVWQNPCNEWSVSANVRAAEFQTHAVLLDTNQPFPSQLIDVRFGTAYRHLFDNDWVAGIGGSFGSASNEPFHSINELTVGVNAFLRIPQGEHNAWLFTLNYSTNSQINVPIPGVAYLWVPSPYFQAVIGFPFASATYRPTDDLTLSVSYALLTTFHARASYRILGPLRLYAAFDTDNESYFLVPREDDRERFFYYEKRVSGGLHYVFGPRVNLDLSGGYAFGRHYFEGRTLSDRSFDRVDVADGPYVALKLMFRY
jgi:hypothetical protein